MKIINIKRGQTVKKEEERSNKQIRRGRQTNIYKDGQTKIMTIREAAKKNYWPGH